ncbi:MAG: META domain-containing protein [Hyphomonadaceae bacterium]|nr:META domain-containing protein [Hyphomonadaceae bacterium]
MSLRIAFLSVLALTACAAPSAGLPQGEWRLAELSGAPMNAPRPTLIINGADISGFAGCNNFSGRVEDDPNVAAFFRDGVAVTEMYCEDPDAMAMERLFLNALNRTGDIRAEGNGIVFYDTDARPIMRFEPAP